MAIRRVGMQYEGEVFAGPTDMASQVVKHIELLRAMESLQPHQRELLDRVVFHDVSLTQIAKEQGVSKAAITMRMKKIYAHLEKILY